MSNSTVNDDGVNEPNLGQILNTPKWVRITWLPYLVVVLGFMVSLSACYILYLDIWANFEFINDLQKPLPWLTLVFGTGISFMMAALIHSLQLTRIQSVHLIKVNEELKSANAEGTRIMESKQKLEYALMQGQKLQAMGTLAGGIAHDFNNILYAIIGYTEMAREDVDKNSQLFQNLGKVLEACHRGQELVSRILTFSRRQHHQLDTLRLKPTIEAVLELLAQTVPASVIINFNMQEDMAIYGNKTLMHQILVNLINNSVDAMDGEGTVHITASRLRAGDPYLNQFPEANAQNYCKIEISDTGHGMDKATIERIFEPFFTTKEVSKGTGLGLSIVHSIIKEHKGEIAVTSQLGKGTTFTILLPEYVQQ
ncbi:MAG TPA: ATP-binding protein [Gammaproteobacteria bacterium]|jgi:signal transduction histidine kinase|nr:ATP-binding protein [Gammaproteobacteria bacterium]